jgi:hypothetical protein
MKYVRLVMESQQTQSFLEDNNIPEVILENIISKVVQYNTDVIKENIHLFVEDNLLDVFENISGTISNDLYILLETYSEIYADASLSSDDKTGIILESSIADKFEDYKDYIKDKAPVLAKNTSKTISKIGSSLHDSVKDVGEKISDVAGSHGLSDAALGYGGVGAGALALLGGAKLAKMAYNRWKAKKENEMGNV